jgi:MFS family permease
MSINPEPALKTKAPFYGWFALSGAILVTIIVGGAFINTFGVFLPVFNEEFGWNRADISLALSLGIAAFGLPSMLFSLAVSKFGVRFTVIVGNLLAAIGLAMLYFISSLWQLYLVYIFLGMAAGFGGYIPCMTLANNWFIGKRALAMSVITAAAGAGGLFFPPLTTVLTQSFGWRESFLILAVMAAATAIISGLLIRNRPEDKGQLPEGYKAPPPSGQEEPIITGKNGAAWKLSDMFRSPAIYLILGFIITNAFTMGTMNTHQIAYIQDIGFSDMTAATTMSVFSILGLLGSLSFGTLALKINMRYLATTGLVLELIGIIILLSSKSLAALYVYAALIGLGTGAIFAAMPSFLGTYYPREHYARVTGLILPFHVVAQSVIAWAVGDLFDVTGSYRLAFYILGGCVIIGAVCAFFARPPKTLR